jgi:hypothetical protein
LCFETKGGEEELSFSCRVGASTSRTATEAAKKQGAKRPANERRRERARRRRKAWEERRRWPASGSAAGGAPAVFAATGEASQPVKVAAVNSNSHWQEQQQQLGQEQQQQRQEKQLPAGVVSVDRSGNLVRTSSRRQEQQPSKEAAAINKISSCSKSRSCGGGGFLCNISGCRCNSYSCYSRKNKSGCIGEESRREGTNPCQEKRF